MKKSILNIGKALNKAEQKEVFGGVLRNFHDDLWAGSGANQCDSSPDCPNGVNPESGNWCQGQCIIASLGNYCKQFTC